MSRPILLLDMDGPLADFDLHVWNEIVVPHGMEMDIESLDDPGRKRFLTDNCVHETDADLMRHRIDNDPFWFFELPLTPGALAGVPALEEHFDVWVCTKPTEANPGCRDGKGAWLRQHFPTLEHKMIVAPDKSLIHGDILLDDAPSAEQIARGYWVPVVFPSVFNGPGSEWEGLHVWAWGDPVEWLVDLVAQEPF